MPASIPPATATRHPLLSGIAALLYVAATLGASGCGPRVEHRTVAPVVIATPVQSGIDTPRIAWRAEVGGAGYLNVPVVYDDLVIVTSSGTRHNEPDSADGLYGVDRATGAILWHVQTASDANRVTVHNGIAAFGTDAGRLVFVRVSDGQEQDSILTAPIADASRVTPRAPDGALLAARLTAQDDIIAPNAFGGGPIRGTGGAPGGRTIGTGGVPLGHGRGRRRVPRPNSIFGAPLATADGGFVVADSFGRIYRWNRGAERGRLMLLYDQEPRDGFRASLVAATDGTDDMFSASLGGVIRRWSPGGAVRWSETVNRDIYAAPLIVEDRIIVPYVRDTDYPEPALVAHDIYTGRRVWHAANGGFPHDPTTQGDVRRSFGNLRSSPVFVAGRIYWQEPYSGDVVSLDPANGEVTGRIRLGDCHFPQWAGIAALNDQYAYAPRFDGRLYAFDPAAGVPRWGLDLASPSTAGEQAPTPSRARGCSWSVPGGQPLYATPTIGPDGTVYVASGHGVLYAIRDTSW